MVIALLSETGLNKLFRWSSNHIITLSYFKCWEVSSANFLEELLFQTVHLNNSPTASIKSHHLNIIKQWGKKLGLIKFQFIVSSCCLNVTFIWGPLWQILLMLYFLIGKSKVKPSSALEFFSDTDFLHQWATQFWLCKANVKYWVL